MAYHVEPGQAPLHRSCDAAGCAGEGLHRAPKARDRLTEYFWFCTDHAREYNKAWDYFAGMTPEAIEAELRRDTTWQRPSWPLGEWRTHERLLRDGVLHGFGFGRHGGGDARSHGPRSEPEMAVSPEAEALKLFGLEPPVDFSRIKDRYRELVKLHHPDAHGGDRDAEERLKQINQAYTTLKASYSG